MRASASVPGRGRVGKGGRGGLPREESCPRQGRRETRSPVVRSHHSLSMAQVGAPSTGIWPQIQVKTSKSVHKVPRASSTDTPYNYPGNLFFHMEYLIEINFIGSASKNYMK